MARVPKNMPLAASEETPALACSLCGLFDRCGGLRVKEAVWDCFEPCRETCSHDLCDWVCPQKLDFWERIVEVGGLRQPSQVRLLPVGERTLPLYVPQIIHGKRRDRRLSERIVAVPTFGALTGSAEGYGTDMGSGDLLREKFRLSPASEVLLVSVAPDQQLERYWRLRRVCRTPERLAKLAVFGMTLPNYSIFLNAPRTHWLFNRSRMLYAGEELSRAGVPVVPHLNASSSVDWHFWEQLLECHPKMRYVCKEFQTGLTRLEQGRGAIVGLARLQDRVGRDLHPIIVGGTRFLEDLVGKFRSFTLVDCNPFMATMHRRRYEFRDARRIRRVAHPTPRGAPLDDLLEENIRLYETWVHERAAARLRPAERPRHPCVRVEMDEDEELTTVGASAEMVGDLVLS